MAVATDGHRKGLGGGEPIELVVGSGQNGQESFLANQRRVEQALGRPMLFVVGSQRSGTTWVQRLLDAHPEVVCKGEGRFFWIFKALHMLRERYNGYQTVGQDARLEDGELVYLFQTIVGLIESRWGSDKLLKWVGEKTPEHCQFLGMLGLAFPGSKVIHIIRDGRDCAVSGWLHANNRKNAEFAAKYPTLGAYTAYAVDNWVRNVEAARAYGQANPDRYLEVRYELMHEQPEQEIGRMLKFLDVKAGDSQVRGCVEGGAFEKLAGGRRRGEEDADSHYRKGVVGDWREHMDAAALEVFMRVGGGLLEGLGYGV